jgi:hypothetical protein
LLNTLARTPVRLALPVLILAVAAGAVTAQQAPPQEQRAHVVRRGDTLWDLARTYLSNPFSWPLIFEANRDVVENPHWIYPSERLIIPPLLERTSLYPIGDPAAAVDETVPVQVWEAAAVTDAAVDADEAVGAATLVATVDLRRPAVSPAEYISTPWLAEGTSAEPAARIVRQADPTVTNSRLTSILLPHDHVHINMAGVGVRPGDSLVVVRAGRRVGVSGQIMEPLAVLRVDTVWTNQVLARVVSQFGEARIGDGVLPLGAVPVLEPGEPEEVAVGPEGHLLEFVRQEPLYGTTDLAFVSLGRSAGVGIGDEFAVYVPAVNGSPPVHVGVARVVRVGETTATVRVVSIVNAGLRDGLPVRLIRKMP